MCCDAPGSYQVFQQVTAAHHEFRASVQQQCLSAVGTWQERSANEKLICYANGSDSFRML